MDSKRYQRTLDKTASELAVLVGPLQHAFRGGDPDWESTVEVRLGEDNMPIPLWALAEGFLVRWTEWSLFRTRFLRLHDVGHETANEWITLEHTCREIADLILPSHGFAQVFGDERAKLKGVVLLHGGFNGDPFDELLDLDDVMRVSFALTCSEDHWLEFRESVQLVFKKLVGSIRELPPSERAALVRDLRAFVLSTLRLPSLTQEEPTGIELILVDREVADMNETNSGAQRRESDKLDDSVIRPLMRGLEELISSVGYDELIDQLLDGDMNGEAILPALTRQSVNVIPGSGGSACCNVLLAFSQGTGKRSPTGWSNVLADVRTHLTRCFPTTKAVLIICDSWDATRFDEDFYNDYATWHDKGVAFVFAVISTVRGQTKLSELAVRFA